MRTHISPRRKLPCLYVDLTCSGPPRLKEGARSSGTEEQAVGCRLMWMLGTHLGSPAREMYSARSESLSHVSFVPAHFFRAAAWLSLYLLTENSSGYSSGKMKPFELQPHSENPEQKDDCAQQWARYTLPRICQNPQEEHLYSVRFHANQPSPGLGYLFP